MYGTASLDSLRSSTLVFILFSAIKIYTLNNDGSSVLRTNLAVRKTVLFPMNTLSYHVVSAFPTLPMFRTIHDTSNVKPEKAFGGTMIFSTLKSGKALVWNPQTGLGTSAPELRTYSILHNIRVSAGKPE